MPHIARSPLESIHGNMTGVEQAGGHRQKEARKPRRGSPRAFQERAPAGADPQTAAMLAHRQRGGSASVEADVKADSLTPAFP
jgi:hypothetical protein